MDVAHRRLLARYLMNVDIRSEDECWPWTLSLFPRGGYGQIRVDGRPEYAHRVGYRLLVEPIPDGELIRHTCDNPPCQNPLHWLTGTHWNNQQDAISRGRAVFPRPMLGSSHPEAKLTDEQVLEIRARRDRSEPLRVLAEEYEVSMALISKIGRREAWRHL